MRKLGAGIGGRGLKAGCCIRRSPPYKKKNTSAVGKGIGGGPPWIPDACEDDDASPVASWAGTDPNNSAIVSGKS